MTPQASRQYRRVPGRPFGAFRRDSLWLAEDHLLSVQSNRFSENYRRYYFGDIQAFTIQRTAPISPWTFVAGAIAAAFLLPGLFFDVQRTFLWVSGALFLAITLALIGFGPTCACYIQTAVSRERLWSLRWMRTAEKALAILRPIIENSQGTLTEEMSGLPSTPPSVPSSAAIAPPPLPISKQPETAWGYEFFFAVLLLDSLHSYLGLSHTGTPMDVAGWTILITEVICVPWLIIRQRRYEVPGAIRVILLLALLITGGLTYAVNILTNLAKQLKTTSGSYPGFIALHITAAALYATLGLAGLVLITRHRQSLRRPAPIASPE